MTRPRLGTIAVHGPAKGSSEHGAPRAHAPPLFQTSAFTFSTAERGVAAFLGGGEYIYSRLANPTVRQLERHVAALEAHPAERSDGPPGRPEAAREEVGVVEDVDARFFASGMAAISAVALGTAAGGRIVCQDGIYGTTVACLRGLPRYGIQVDFVPAGDLEALRKQVAGGPPPALVYIETPANPLLQLTDIHAAAEIAHEAGGLLAVDATFATPALQRPLAWGADFSLHSTTKFMSGHGVVLGGIVSGRRELLERHVDGLRRDFGAVADPFAAWLTLLGLRTLAVRMERHAENAAALATRLAQCAEVSAVYYPDPGRLPAGQLSAGGPMLSVELAGGEPAALGLIDRLGLATLAPTLGTTDTLVQHPYTMSHGVLPEERRRALGILPGIVRVSVGLEDPEDIVADFEQALAGGRAASAGPSGRHSTGGRR
ncbi:MAG: trans-sulfuration enzyme family protein [Gemmatimonadota bacterium]